MVAGRALTTTITMTNILTGCLTNYMATDLRVAQQVFELFLALAWAAHAVCHWKFSSQEWGGVVLSSGWVSGWVGR